MRDDLLKYLNYFKKVNRGFNKGLGYAPHKPIFLISLADLVKNNALNDNRLSITAELVLTFKENFEKLVTSDHLNNFILPFFHLKSEPFYRLTANRGMHLKLNKLKSLKSINKALEVIAYAEIDRSLFKILKDPISNEIIRQFILSEFFPNQIDSKTQNNKYARNIVESEILEETATNYKIKIGEMEKSLDRDLFEEEIFIRSSMFKNTVPKVYNYTCCITGMKIHTNRNIQMVDACHIIPFSVSQDDTIKNGISLSPSAHRAFDRGLITINDDYIIRVSPSINKSKSTSEFSLLEGKQIYFPEKEKYYPSLESLEWHRKEVFLL